MKKFLCLFLMLSLLLTPVLCSCADSDGDGGADSSSQDDASTEAPDGKTNLQTALDGYGGIRLDGQTFRILSPNPGEHFYWFSGSEENEIYYEELGSEALPNAIYYRNLAVTEALGVEIEPVWGGSSDNISTIVQQTHAAGDKEEFNVVLNRLDYEINYAVNGQLLNFYNIQSMDLEHRWWDEDIIDAFTLYGDKLYTLSGDINYYDDYAVQIVLFNQKICKDINYEYPYEAVKNGTWTVDYMFEMATAARYDFSGDGVYTPGTDILGIGENPDCVLHFIYNYGLRMSDVDDDGLPQITPPGDYNTGVVERLCDYFSDADVASIEWNNSSNFSNEKLLFYCEMLGSLPNFISMEQDFGILPMPKGNTDIDGYKAYVSNGWTTAYAVPSVFTSTETYDIGIVLECLSAASMDLVTPALYDQLLQSRYIRDEESVEMLSYILDSKVYDLAGDLSWAESLRGVYQNVLTNGGSSFSTAFTAISKSSQKQLERFCEKLAELNY